MTEGTGQGQRDLFADPELRIAPERAERSELKRSIIEAAEWLSRSLSTPYDRLARFFGDGAKTVHLGGRSPSAAFSRLERHLGSLRDAALEGLKQAMRAETRAVASLFDAATPEAPSVLPQNLRGFASRRNPYGSFGVMARVEAIAAFSRAQAKRSWRADELLSGREAARLRPHGALPSPALAARGAAGIPDIAVAAATVAKAARTASLAALVALRLAGAKAAEKAGHLGTKVRDGIGAAGTFASDAVEQVKLSADLRRAAKSTALAGLAVAGIFALPAPAHGPMDARAYRAFAIESGQALGASDAGFEILRASLREALEVTSAFQADGEEAAPAPLRKPLLEPRPLRPRV